MTNGYKIINVTELLARLSPCEKAIHKENRASLRAMLASLNHFQWEEARNHFNRSLEWKQLHQTTTRIRQTVAEPEVDTLVAESWFCEDLIRHLTTGQDEDIAHVTGPQMDGVRIMSRICELPRERQSPVYAKADPFACANMEIEILEHGNALHCMAHCHPGSGAGSTFPSGTDKNYLGRIQKIGSKVIGIIVSRDGWMRFFTVTHPFRVQITGNGATKVEENLYHVAL